MRLVALSVTIIAICGSAAAQAPPTSTPLSGVYACAGQTDDGARLRCYDEAVQRLQAAEASGNVVAVDREQVGALERQSFGLQLPALSSLLPRRGGEAQQIERVEALMTRVVSLPDGRHAFVLDNGQSWAQIEPRSASNVDAGDSISIRRASLGSFVLSPEHGAMHRVRRVE